jgi:pentatricopeptide repeat domain-containing protein 1
MAMRYSFLFSVSRVLTRQGYNLCQKHLATTAIFPDSLKKKEFAKKLSIEQNDPDVFGTLSLRENLGTQKLDSILNHEQSIDEGDVAEEKFLSFIPADRKNVEEFELKIKQLIDDRKLKEALFQLEVTMKEDKVKPSRGIFSMLIGACGRAGYTKKAFSLFNVVNYTNTAQD